ncbi:MAG: hypothetical protein ACHQ3O_07550 [Candidatus Limnocylindria bacterium]
MLERLKRLLRGDPRPVDRIVEHPVLGTLSYSEDNDAWLTDPETAACGFGFYVAGDRAPEHERICPDPMLLEHAAALARDPDAIRAKVAAHLASHPPSLNELRRAGADHPPVTDTSSLKIYRICLMWPDRPNDGEIELRVSFSDKRFWVCSYVDRSPAHAVAYGGMDI